MNELLPELELSVRKGAGILERMNNDQRDVKETDDER